MKKLMLLNATTMLAEPGVKVVYANHSIIDPQQLRRAIVDNHLIGRHF